MFRVSSVSGRNLSPLYHGQLLVHGMGFSPDHRTIAVVSIGSNSVAFIDTATNALKHITYVGRSPHEAFFTPDGSEVWVTVRGENYISVLDGTTYEEKTRIVVPNGPGMQIFSPDGKYRYVCSSFTPQTVVIAVADHKIAGRIPQASPFCPNIAATPDGRQVWFTLKDTGKTQVFDARPPFTLLKTIDTGPITNHVNFAHNSNGTLAYVTVGGLNEVLVFRTSDFSKVASVPVGNLPHGIWPSGDGTRVYVGLENADRLIAIDTLTNKVIATVPIGQAPQAVNYVPDAVPAGNAVAQGLQPLGVAGETAHLILVPVNGNSGRERAPTSVSLFDQVCCRCCKRRSPDCRRTNRMSSRFRAGLAARACSCLSPHSPPIRRDRQSSMQSGPSGRSCVRKKARNGAILRSFPARPVSFGALVQIQVP